MHYIKVIIYVKTFSLLVPINEPRIFACNNEGESIMVVVNVGQTMKNQKGKFGSSIIRRKGIRL